jgi:hypothetical protein
MKTGTKVRHKTKGMVETVVGSCKVKVNGVWVDGIVYEGNDVNTGEPMTFVRTKEDFENDFVVIPDQYNDLTSNALNKRLEYDFRAEQMKIAIKNRIYWLENGLLSPIFEDERIDRKSQIKAYEDCLDILNKEFFELDLPEDEQIDIKIHEIKDIIANKICPVDDRTRGSRDYLINFKRRGEIAEIIEGLCYQMFNHGYNYNYEYRWHKK